MDAQPLRTAAATIFENQFLSGHFPHHELRCCIVLVARLRPLFRAAVTLSYGFARVKTIALEVARRAEFKARLPMSNLLSLILMFVLPGSLDLRLSASHRRNLAALRGAQCAPAYRRSPRFVRQSRPLPPNGRVRSGRDRRGDEDYRSGRAHGRTPVHTLSFPGRSWYATRKEAGSCALSPQ